MRPIILAVVAVLMARVASAGPLRVGAAAVVITPPLGTAMAGYYEPRYAQGVDNDLYAKAIVIQSDDAKAAIVSCDLIHMPGPIVERARELIQKQTGLAPDHVMISATHCHTGPVLPIEGHADQSQNWDLDLARRYVAMLPTLIAQSVIDADAKLQDARVLAGAGQAPSLPFNRRYIMKDGTVGWNPGKLNANIVKPAGPVDPQVPVVYFESSDGTPLVTYTNFAMHLDTVGGRRISADFPYTLHTLLRKLKGEQLVSVFTIGTAGDINHIDVHSPDRQQGEAEAARIGTILAGQVLQTCARLSPVHGTRLRCASRMIDLDLAPITPQDVKAAQTIAAESPKARRGFLERVNAFKVLEVAARAGKPLHVQVQTIALGDDLAWVALPGEIFVELGLRIKHDSPFAHTIIATLANGHVGYVPTRRAWAQGNYEVVSARCAPGSGERLADTALELLRQLK